MSTPSQPGGPADDSDGPHGHLAKPAVPGPGTTGHGFGPPPAPPPNPPPGPPTQPAPPGGWAPPPPARFEPLAVWAFALALVALFPLALVLGVVALGRLAAGPGRGRGLAVTAIALAGAQIVALAVLVPLALEDAGDGPGRTAGAGQRESADDKSDGERNGDPDDGRHGDRDQGNGPGAGGEETTVFEIEVGDCFDSPDGIERYEGEGALEESVTVLPCGDPHEGEVFGSVEVTGYDAFPGVAELIAYAERECPALVPSYVLDTWALPVDVLPYYYHPEADGWEAGDREILCFFGQLEGEPLSEPLRGDPATLDEESLAYLEVTGPLEVAVWYEPSRDEDELATSREWAGEMAAAIEDEMTSLAGTEWPRVAEPVDRLLAARERSLPAWESAASATDEAAFWAAVDEGYATMGIEIELEIRETLGLVTG